MFRCSTYLTFALAVGFLGTAFAQHPAPDAALLELKERLDAQELEIQDLRERLESSGNFAGPISVANDPSCRYLSDDWMLPVVVEDYQESSCAANSSYGVHTLQFIADYDHGFTFRPINPKKKPFELRINGWIQFRHLAFARDVTTWIDNAGVPRPVRSRNHFEMERARLVFSGYAIDQRLTYFLQLDGDTDDGERVDFFDYWWGWQCNDRFQVQLGKRKVPASRQWLLGARYTRLVDRPMACDFFRPNRTTGVFGVGRIGKRGHYEVMAGNGYNTSNLSPDGVNNRFSFAFTNYWDCGGDFGDQLTDFECRCKPLSRFGHSFVFSPQSGIRNGNPLPESDVVRMTDGTQLTQLGALAPGVTVSIYDTYLYTIDLATKYRGWSVNAELFLRWFEDIRGDAVLPVRNLFQRGFYVEGGRFLVPRKLDFNFRYSQVNGLFGNSSEYAAGFNFYPKHNPHLKISFDVTQLDGSPVDSRGSEVRVGDDGTLFRTQFQAEY